jgi:hypothetical protein
VTCRVHEGLIQGRRSRIAIPFDTLRTSLDAGFRLPRRNDGLPAPARPKMRIAALTPALSRRERELDVILLAPSSISSCTSSQAKPLPVFASERSVVVNAEKRNSVARSFCRLDRRSGDPAEAPCVLCPRMTPLLRRRR